MASERSEANHGYDDLCDLEDSAIEHMWRVCEAVKSGSSDTLAQYNEPSPKMTKAKTQAFFTIPSWDANSLNNTPRHSIAENERIVDRFALLRFAGACADDLGQSPDDSLSGKKRPRSFAGM